MKVNKLLEKLPICINIRHKAPRCEKCGEVPWSGDDDKVVTAFGPNIHWSMLSGGHVWSVRYKAESYDWIEKTSTTLEEAIGRMLDYVEENKNELSPIYRKEGVL